VFKGFQDSAEFNEYMSILQEWEVDNASAHTALDVGSAAKRGEAEELQRAIGDVISAAVSVKEFQQEYQASINNLRQ
jgi:hypothetical protein